MTGQNAEKIVISLRVVPTDQWLRTHVSPTTTIEKLKIHALEVCLGKVTPRVAGKSTMPIGTPEYSIPYAPPPSRPTTASAASSSATTTSKPALRVDVNRQGVFDPSSSLSATSPIGSPISPSGNDGRGGLFGTLRGSRSNQQLSQALANASASASRPTTSSGASRPLPAEPLDVSEDSDDEDDAEGPSSRGRAGRGFPVFAPNDGDLEYEYHSDSPSADYHDLDGPSDSQNEGTASEQVDHYDHESRHAVPPMISQQGQKEPTRVAFHDSVRDHSHRAHLTAAVPLSKRQFEQATRQRASNWTLFSYSNSLYLDDHRTLQELGIRANEHIEIHRRGRCTTPSRRTYAEPYFDSLAYVGRQKGKHKPSSDGKKSRTLSIRSSSSSMNMRAAISSMGYASGSRSQSLRNKISGESFDSGPGASGDSPGMGFVRVLQTTTTTTTTHNVGAMVPVMGPGGEDIGVLVTKPETPSPPSSSNRAYRGGGAIPIYSHRPMSLGAAPPSSGGAHTPPLRPSPSLTFRPQERLLGLTWRLRWVVIQNGWLIVWKDRNCSKTSTEHSLTTLLAVKEVIHEKTLPSHPVQHWRYLLATFAKTTENGEDEVVCLNLPDDGVHQNAFRILYRIARYNHEAILAEREGRRFPSYPTPYGSQWREWREKLMETAKGAGRWDRNDILMRYEQTEAARRGGESSASLENPLEDPHARPGRARGNSIVGDESEREWEGWDMEYGGRDAVFAFDFSLPAYGVTTEPFGRTHSHARDRSVTISASPIAGSYLFGSGAGHGHGQEAVGESRISAGHGSPAGGRSRTKSFTNALPGVMRPPFGSASKSNTSPAAATTLPSPTDDGRRTRSSTVTHHNL